MAGTRQPTVSRAVTDRALQRSVVTFQLSWTRLHDTLSGGIGRLGTAQDGVEDEGQGDGGGDDEGEDEADEAGDAVVVVAVRGLVGEVVVPVRVLGALRDHVALEHAGREIRHQFLPVAHKSTTPYRNGGGSSGWGEIYRILHFADTV